MKKALSRRDLELLSAYLDQQVKAGDRQKVEARLREDAQFRNSYERLRQTRQLIRSLPKARAPRNFTLSPDQARISSYQRFKPVFGFSSALAAFLFILALIGDFLFVNPRVAMAPAAVKESIPQVAMHASTAEKSLAQDFAMETTTEATLSKEAAAGAQMASTTETPEPPRAAGLLDTPPPEATMGNQDVTMKSAPLTNTLVVTSTVESRVLESLPPQTTPGEQVVLSTPGSLEAATQELVPSQEPTASQEPAGNSWIRWLEVMLGLIAIGSGILYILARRSLSRP